MSASFIFRLRVPAFVVRAEAEIRLRSAFVRRRLPSGGEATSRRVSGFRSPFPVVSASGAVHQPAGPR